MMAAVKLMGMTRIVMSNVRMEDMKRNEYLEDTEG
jgi:hypothetical protein